MNETECTIDGIRARYYETDRERVLEFDRDGLTAVVVQNVDGYAMLSVRPGVTDRELERYYGLEPAIDHVAELLAVDARALPIPEAASDMGM